MFMIINFAHWLENSKATVPIPTVIMILLLYCVLSVPNIILGAFIGFKKSTIKNPGKINKLSRDIPAQPWYLRMKLFVPIGGVFPFA
jgi:hypothetical protein